MTGENCVKNCGGLVEDQDPPLHTKHITERLVLPTMKTTTTPKPAAEDLSLRKRKMKRVKVERGRGKISESRSRAILNRARLRSRMSSSSSVVSSSTEQSIGQNELEVSRTFRRPARMVGSTNGRNSTSSSELETHFNGVGATRNELYPPRARHRDYLGGSRRVDEVMKAPPNMKGGLVVIRSYCRFFEQRLSKSKLIESLPGIHQRSSDEEGYVRGLPHTTSTSTTSQQRPASRSPAVFAQSPATGRVPQASLTTLTLFTASFTSHHSFKFRHFFHFSTLSHISTLLSGSPASAPASNPA